MYDVDYLDETAVAGAMNCLDHPALYGSLLHGEAGPVRRLPVADAQALVAQLVTAQPAAMNAGQRPLTAYRRYLEDQVLDCDLEAAREERRTEPFLDSVVYELACEVKLATFEHWQATIAEHAADEVI